MSISRREVLPIGRQEQLVHPAPSTGERRNTGGDAVVDEERDTKNMSFRQAVEHLYGPDPMVSGRGERVDVSPR